MKYRIFILIFFLLCVIPAAGMLVTGPAQPAANETLPQMPALHTPEGTFNKDVLEEFSSYFEERFAFRQEMITASRTLSAAVFRTSTEEKVILGKEGWLFYGETLDDYERVNPMTDREIWSAAHSLALFQEACETQGATFLFTVAPNKNTLYGEYMPDRYPVADRETDLSRLTAALAEENVLYADLLTPLLDQEEILYRKQDSHWTQKGAALAGDTILVALNREESAYFAGPFEEAWQAKGDLYEMLFPAGEELDRDEVCARDFTFTYITPIRSAEDTQIRTACPKKTGSLVMFRDSFGNALYPFLAESFGAACFSRVTPYDITCIQQEQADTVVIELVQRNLDWLITRPAIFPAPERDLDRSGACPADLELTLTAEACGSLPGFLTVQGEWSGICPDTTSPLYLLWGDTVYELTPTGENRFSGCLPQQVEGTPCRLLFFAEGRLTESNEITIEKGE